MASSCPNKVVFITGAAKRIGACTAEYLHQQGFNLVIHYHHSEYEAHTLVNKLNAQRTDSALAIQANLTHSDELASLAAQAKSAFGRLDVLINNASAFYSTDIAAINEQDWSQLVGSNMQAPLYLSQLCSEALTSQAGCIINMADIHAFRPLKGHTLYCMAKSALITMTQSLAQELAPSVRVNAVAPGAILWPEKPLSEQQQAQILSEIPARRLGKPIDIAKAIYFFICAEYITGQVLAVDGGRSIASTSTA